MKAAPLAIAFALGLGSASALAQGVDEFGAYGGMKSQSDRSPQDAAFEVRFGRYLPNADEGVNGTPFDDTFGDGNRYLIGIEVDWQALRLGKVGSFGPGFGIGYTKANARAIFADGTGRSKQKTSLAILPMYLVGVLRVDLLPETTSVPLVPYGKLGFGYGLWWSDDGGELAEFGNDKAQGSSLGYQGALGLMVLLDPLEPETSASFDASMGVNHSYLFGEWYVSKLDGFGGEDLQVGTNTWMLGIAMEL